MDTENNNENLNNIINGWEYLTDINPTKLVTEQKLQDSYLMNYNLAYHKFLKTLCIEKENLNSIVDSLKTSIDSKTERPITKYRFIIDTSEDNDVINDDDYPIKFLKSKFINFKLKKLKTDLISYYKPLGFYIKGPFPININNKINKYYIELCWNTESASKQ